MKLKKIVRFSGTIQCVTGLAIKSASNELGIGGADSEVIKNPVTGEPYLPGSSLKGKMRSQLEKKYGAQIFDRRGNRYMDEFAKPCGCGRKDCMICTIFGAHMNPGAQSAPTRIIVRDSSLTQDCLERFQSIPLERGSYLEVKAENMIKRDKGTAESPRFMERVPAGAEFTLEILLQIFDCDNEQALTDRVKEALSLVERSYLGGSGSRGYGQVKFDYKVESEEV